MFNVGSLMWENVDGRLLLRDCCWEINDGSLPSSYFIEFVIRKLLLGDYFRKIVIERMVLRVCCREIVWSLLWRDWCLEFNVKPGSILTKNSAISRGTAWTRRLRFVLRLWLQYKSVKNKQLWVICILKSIFLSLPILNLISNSIIVLSLMCWKSHMVKLQN